MMGRASGFLTTLLVLCIGMGAASVSAEEKSKEQKAAELLVKGIDLYKREFWREAISHFEKANGLVFDPANLYNIARCYDNLGEFRQAAIYYQEYINKGGENAKKASNYLESIKLIPGTVIITSTPEGAKVYIDESTAAAGKTPLEIDIEPGNHEFSVKKAGYAQQTKTKMIGFAEVMEIHFTLWESSEQHETTELDETYEKWDEPVQERSQDVDLITELPARKAPHTFHLLSMAGGISFPVYFDEAHSFVGWSLIWQAVRGSAGGGLGMDLQFGGTMQIDTARGE